MCECVDVEVCEWLWRFCCVFVLVVCGFHSQKKKNHTSNDFLDLWSLFGLPSWLDGSLCGKALWDLWTMMMSRNQTSTARSVAHPVGAAAYHFVGISPVVLLCLCVDVCLCVFSQIHDTAFSSYPQVLHREDRIGVHKVDSIIASLQMYVLVKQPPHAPSTQSSTAATAETMPHPHNCTPAQLQAQLARSLYRPQVPPNSSQRAGHFQKLRPCC